MAASTSMFKSGGLMKKIVSTLLRNKTKQVLCYWDGQQISELTPRGGPMYGDAAYIGNGTVV